VALGPLWVAAPLALRDLPLARRGLVLVLLCLISMTFALDWGRAIFFAAPVFFAAGAHTVRGRPGATRVLLLALLALDLGYAIYMKAHGIHSGLDPHGPPARGPVV
jgi:hypothetical protein